MKHKLLAPVLASILLFGCVGSVEERGNKSEQLASKIDKLRSTVSRENSLVLGAPAYKVNDSEMPLIILNSNDQCIDVHESDNIIGNTITTSLTYVNNLNTFDLDSIFGISGNINLSLANNLDLDAYAYFSNLLEQHEGKITYSLIYKVTRPVSLAKTYSQPAISEQCGNSYISTATAGIYIIANVVVKVADSTAENAIRLLGAAQYADLLSFKASIDKLDSYYKSLIDIEIGFTQFGGDSAKILSYLGNNQSSSSATYLSDTSLENAGKIIQKIQNYINSDDLHNQIESYVAGLQSVGQLRRLYVTSQNAIEATKYSSPTEDNINYTYLNTIKDHKAVYSTLLSAYMKYRKFYDWITPYLNDDYKLSENLINLHSFKTQASELLQSMETTAHVCYKIVGNNQSSDYCIQKLTRETTAAANQVQAIKDSKFNYAIKLSSLSEQPEYLIYLGDDPMLGPVFVTYAKSPFTSYFRPGTLYTVDNNSFSAIFTPDTSWLQQYPSYFLEFPEIAYQYNNGIIDTISYPKGVEYFDENYNQVTPEKPIDNILKLYEINEFSIF